MMSSTIAPTTVPPSVEYGGRLPVENRGLGDALHLLGDVQQEPRAAERTDHRAHGGADLATTVGPDDDIVGEHGQEPREVPGGAGHEKAVHQGAPLAQVGVEALAPLLDPLPCPRPELAAGGRSPSERARHLVEGVPEDVVEQVGGALERRQLLEQHEEGQRQRVRLLGGRLLLDHHRLGQPRTGVGDARGPGGIELVEAEAGHDGDEIGADRFDGIVACGAASGWRHPGRCPPRRRRCPACDRRCRTAAGAIPRRRPLGVGVRRRHFAASGVRGDARIGISQSSENPWLRRPSPALKRERKFSSATQAASSTNSASLRWARIRAASSSETSAGLPVATSAYSRTARSRSSKRSLVRQLPTARTLAGSTPVVHPFVVAVVDAPGAADLHAGGLHGEPAQRRIELLPAELDRRLEAAHGDEDAGVVCCSRGGLDHLAEAVLGVAGAQAGDEALRVVLQRNVSHDSPSFPLCILRHHHQTGQGPDV